MYTNSQLFGLYGRGLDAMKRPSIRHHYPNLVNMMLKEEALEQIDAENLAVGRGTRQKYYGEETPEIRLGGKNGAALRDLSRKQGGYSNEEALEMVRQQLSGRADELFNTPRNIQAPEIPEMSELVSPWPSPGKVRPRGNRRRVRPPKQAVTPVEPIAQSAPAEVATEADTMAEMIASRRAKAQTEWVKPNKKLGGVTKRSYGMNSVLKSMFRATKNAKGLTGLVAGQAALGATAAAAGTAGYMGLSFINPNGTEVSDPISNMVKGGVVGGAYGMAVTALSGVGTLQARGIRNSGAAIQGIAKAAEFAKKTRVGGSLLVGAAIMASSGSFSLTRKTNGVW